MNSPSSSERLRPTLLLWLLWLSTTAALLAIHREDFVGSTGSSNAEFNARQRVVSRINRVAIFSVAPFHALGIVGLGTAISFRIKKRSGFPVSPGHWLLVCVGAYVFSNELCQLAWHWLIVPPSDVASNETFERLMFWSNVLDSAPYLVAAIMTGFACYVRQAQPRWKLVFLLGVLTAATYLVLGILHTVDNEFYSVSDWIGFAANAFLQISALTVAINAIIDLIARRNRDLIHWLGIVSALAFVAHADTLHLSIWYAFLE